MPPDEPNPEEQQEEERRDYQTPFSPPSDVPGTTTEDGSQTTYPTHPQTDSNVQLEEIYDAGPYAASGIPEPIQHNNVTAYDPNHRVDHSVS